MIVALPRQRLVVATPTAIRRLLEECETDLALWSKLTVGEEVTDVVSSDKVDSLGPRLVQSSVYRVVV